MVQPLSAITDPTELRQRTEMMLRMAGNLAKFGGWSLDVATNTNFWSAELCQILGYPAGTPPKVTEAYALYPDVDREIIAKAMAACADDGTPVDEVLNMHDVNGRLLRVHVVAEALRDADGSISRIEGAFHDITAQEQERQARVEMELRLTSALDSLTDGLITFDTEWRYTYMNPRAEQMRQVRREDVLGKVLWEVTPHRADLGFASTMLRAVAENRTLSIREYHPDLQFWLELTAYPSESGLAVYMRDVTEDETIKRDSIAKAKTIASQADLLDIARDAIIVRSMDHRLQYVNRAAEELYGWTPSEAIGMSVRDQIFKDRDAFDAAMEAVLRDGQWTGDVEQRTRSGRQIIVECSWTLVRDADGNPQSIFSVNTDVTSRRREDDLTLRRQRMESIGTLASGIAHDLNNVLAPLLLGVQLLSSTETDAKRAALLTTMETSVKRGADMIRQVLSFARGAEGKRVVVDLVRLLLDLEAFGREALPSNVVLSMNVPKSLWHTVGDPIQLQQVLVNLITNARDALPGGGVITISARNTELNGEYASVSHLAGPGKYVAIDVEDNGSGMTADIVSKAFEPFFTTKEHGHGTGLGLASSLAIVRAHGGYMQVYSEPGHGSRFQLHLVAAVDGAVRPARSESGAMAELPLGNGEYILVVDDEDAIRGLTCETLESYGYRTAQASNGAEALALISESVSPIDLVLTDMMMPKMGGAEFIAELAEAWPTIPIIAMSGLSANGDIAIATAGAHQFLSKPFTTDTLIRSVATGIHGHGRLDA